MRRTVPCVEIGERKKELNSTISKPFCSGRFTRRSSEVLRSGLLTAARWPVHLGASRTVTVKLLDAEFFAWLHQFLGAVLSLFLLLKALPIEGLAVFLVQQMW